MKREEALKVWLPVVVMSVSDGRMPEVKEAVKMAVKALEQEPILDKIRAEIKQAADKQFQIAMGVSDLNERYAHTQMENAYRHSLNVIEKYKAESEDAV